MTIQEIQSAIFFLRKMTVGVSEVDRLIATVEALENEIERRRAKK